MPAVPPSRMPVSTYRLQFHAGFGFREARELAPYLARLGVTECYASPLLAAGPGSTHGYDICDHSRLNPELGSPDDFRAFAQALADGRMGLILDVVPNHMGIDPSANRWWRSVLENGPSSPFARFFDIDWDPVKDELQGKVLLPILGRQYGAALDGGELRIHLDRGSFTLRYFDRDLPLNPRQLRKLLRHDLASLESELGPEDRHLKELLSILFQLDHMPVYTETAPDSMADRLREKDVAQERLSRLMEASPRIRRHVEENVRRYNGEPGRPATHDLLHDLLEAQAYRLSYWRTALHEINYRRFFDSNELAGLRMEDPDVFEATHGFVLSLISQGVVTGLRLDHVDGLYDPPGYLDHLASRCPRGAPVYIVAEKIVSADEPLREEWAIHGTTGYGFLNTVNGLFVNSRNARAFAALYSRWGGGRKPFADVVYESKKVIITASMVSELNVLARALNRISEREHRYRDYTLASIQEALREVVACFPVYRTYVSDRGWTDFDERTIRTAIASAVRRNPAMEASIFEFIRQALLPARSPDASEEDYRARLQFAMKFQQYTGPVHAKGLEDTAFYRHAPLLSLNEVGGDPARFGSPPEEFHDANGLRLRLWPLAMLATSTHDTKRGEDARARLSVLSELPDEWRREASRWARVNAALRTLVHGEPAPDRTDEYLFYQALLGAWPAGGGAAPEPPFVERMLRYMQKATKEAKVHTSWIHPSDEYDNAVSDFVRSALAGPRAERFLRLFVPFQQRIARLGMVNSLSQVVLKIASPGVPDFYQGTELWDLSLVDPDNRRPVDFPIRQRLLDELEPLLDPDRPGGERRTGVGSILERWQDGRIKLYVTAMGLRLRRAEARLLLEGTYVPLVAEGPWADHVLAFARVREDRVLLAIVPRLIAGLPGAQQGPPLGPGTWQETRIRLPGAWPAHGFRDVLTGNRIVPSGRPPEPEVRLADALRVLPVGLLLSEADAAHPSGT